MKKFFYINISVLLSISLVLLCSCKKQEVKETIEETPEKVETLRPLNEKVLLILGEAYYQKPNILECLNKEYNEASIKQNVVLLPYDLLMVKEDFLRLKVIEEKINEVKPSVIISLGLPERAGRYLLRAINEYKEMVVITAFAMEEIAKLEAASDIVLDFKLPDELLNPENDFYISDSELSLVLLASFLSSENIKQHGKNSNVLPIEDAKEAFKKAGELLSEHMGQNEYILKPYIDTDIGMASYNYIMIHKHAIENKALH